MVSLSHLFLYLFCVTASNHPFPSHCYLPSVFTICTEQTLSKHNLKVKLLSSQSFRRKKKANSQLKLKQKTHQKVLTSFRCLNYIFKNVSSKNSCEIVSSNLLSNDHSLALLPKTCQVGLRNNKIKAWGKITCAMGSKTHFEGKHVVESLSTRRIKACQLYSWFLTFICRNDIQNI